MSLERLRKQIKEGVEAERQTRADLKARRREDWLYLVKGSRVTDVFEEAGRILKLGSQFVEVEKRKPTAGVGGEPGVILYWDFKEVTPERRLLTIPSKWTCLGVSCTVIEAPDGQRGLRIGGKTSRDIFEPNKTTIEDALLEAINNPGGRYSRVPPSFWVKFDRILPTIVGNQ